MSFVHRPNSDATLQLSDICLVIHGDRLLAALDGSSRVSFPDFDSIASWRSAPTRPIHVGTIDGCASWSWTVDEVEAPPPAGWQWHETRALLNVFTPSQSHAISCARQLVWWEQRHRFCGTCGTPTIEVAEERARRCPACSAMFFPVVSPAVIVAVTRGDELLLAHNRNFRAGMFSLLAGFVDPGETLEQAAIREVREEVGIVINDLRYIASQPWSFPNSLMIGFRASYVSGELAVDGREIEQAEWFNRAQMPEIPRPGTVARLIIDGWLNRQA